MANTIEFRTSLDASKTTCRIGRGVGLSLFSRNRLKTFSTSTIASSTTSPTAIARPPSVIVFTDRPNQYMTIALVKNDSGMAVSVIAVVRRLSRNRNRTRATMIVASRQRRLDVVDRRLDEIGLPEQRAVDLDVGGQ